MVNNVVLLFSATNEEIHCEQLLLYWYLLPKWTLYSLLDPPPPPPTHADPPFLHTLLWEIRNESFPLLWRIKAGTLCVMLWSYVSNVPFFLPGGNIGFRFWSEWVRGYPNANKMAAIQHLFIRLVQLDYNIKSFLKRWRLWQCNTMKIKSANKVCSVPGFLFTNLYKKRWPWDILFQ